MQQTILLATGNAKKLAELCDLVIDLPVRILSPADLPHGLPEVEENQPDFCGNAIKKASSAATAAMAQLGPDVWVLADDSGLCVDALHGAPGVFSARYSGIEGDRRDAANNAKLLAELQGIPEQQRGAAFHCAIALATPNEVLFTVEGTVAGRILPESDGTEGFGYDPLFFHPPSNTTFARLSAAQKAAVSHRGIAVQQFRVKLIEGLHR